MSKQKNQFHFSKIMGNIRKFEKIKFKPVEMRKGSLVFTNFCLVDKKKKSLQSHLKHIPKYSFFEILKEEINPLHGKLHEYENRGGGLFSFFNCSCYDACYDESCFTNPFHRYMIAHWEKLNHDERIPDLVFCGDRPFDLTHEEQLDFMFLANYGQKHIMKVLNSFNEEEHE